MATLVQKPVKQYRDLSRAGWRWEEGVLDTGHPAYFLRVQYKAKPIIVTKVLTNNGTMVEWGVYAKGRAGRRRRLLGGRHDARRSNACPTGGRPWLGLFATTPATT